MPSFTSCRQWRHRDHGYLGLCKDLKIKERTAKAGSADVEGCRADITPLDEGKELTSSLLYTPIKSFSLQIQDRNAQEIL